MTAARGAGSRRLWWPAWGLVALAAGFGRCTCSSPASSSPDGGLEAGVDARADRSDRAAFLDAALPDGQGPLPDAQPCDATFIELPPQGDSFISVVSNQGRWVAYDYREFVGAAPNVYLYDLETCTEYQITHETWFTRDQPHIWDGKVVYAYQATETEWKLAQYDIQSGVTTFLPTVPGEGSVSVLGSIGNSVAYAKRRAPDENAPVDFYLLEIATGQSIYLESTDDGASSGGDMGDTRFTWPSLVANDFAGIWYVDFATKDPTMLEGTNRGADPSAWGDWIVWEDWRSGVPDIWGERVGAGEQVQITDNPYWDTHPRLRRNLLCYRTNVWGGTTGWDIALMDMDTWVVRRITTTPHPGYKCGHADGGWLVYRKQVRPGDNGWDKIYAIDLVANGFLDAQGHLIPE